MPHSLSDLDLAVRHVAEGKARVDHQRMLLAQLRRGGHSTAQAEWLLALLELTLLHMVRHREIIMAEFEDSLREAGGPALQVP